MAAKKRKRKKGQLSGLKADGTPNAYWRRFKERLATYDQTPVDQWKDEQVLAHILRRYKDYTGIDFSLSHSGAPTKCQEMYCVRRMRIALGTEEGAILKQYVDWVFDNIIQPQNIDITSIAFFFTGKFVWKFKAELRKNSRITRSTELPPHYQAIAHELSANVTTYGELAFAKLAVDADPNNQAYSKYVNLFDKLKEVGFDDHILTNLEN
jgi:hypothetical protein